MGPMSRSPRAWLTARLPKPPRRHYMQRGAASQLRRNEARRTFTCMIHVFFIFLGRFFVLSAQLAVPAQGSACTRQCLHKAVLAQGIYVLMLFLFLISCFFSLPSEWVKDKEPRPQKQRATTAC